MRLNRVIITLTIASACMTSCTRQPEYRCDIAPLYKSVVEFADMSESQRDSMMRADSVCLKAMFDVVSPGDMSATHIIDWSRSPAVEVFSTVTDNVYPDVEGLSAQVGAILHNAEAEGIGLPERRYAAVVWGNLKSIVFVDNVMLIALNHYLGADFKGYNNSLWPAYMRTEKTPENLPYDIAEALIATEKPYEGGENATALSRMLYEGALIEAKMRLVKDASVALALGYNEAQLDWFEHNSVELWKMLVAGKYVYDVNPETASRLVDRAPATSILAPYVPGRAGRYVGYEILRAYQKRHGRQPLSTLLSPKFYNSESVLIESGYTGSTS